MSFTLQAPYPRIQTTSILPNPTFGDSEGVVQSQNLKRSIDGTVRTYIKRAGRRKMAWSFVMTRNKAIELREFAYAYHASKVLVETHNGRKYSGFIMNNPLEITSLSRSAPGRQDLEGEKWEVTIEFEGAPLTNVNTSTAGECYTLDQANQPKTVEASATSEISLTQRIFNDMGVPIANPLHNWDAAALSGLTNGDRLVSIPNDGTSSITLIPRPTSDFMNNIDPTLDLAPQYFNNQFCGPSSLWFGATSGDVWNGFMSMRSSAAVNFFPNRRGTVFFVHKHSVGGPPGDIHQWLQDSSLWNLWNIAVDDVPMESFDVGGGANIFHPATWSTSPDVLPDLFHPVLGTGGNKDEAPATLTRGRPYVHTLQRNTDTNMRWRLNGFEQSGRTIPNNPPANGIFRWNQPEVLPNIGLTPGDEAYFTQVTAPIPTGTLRGHFAQFIVYDYLLTDTQIEAVERYLIQKWAARSDRCWYASEACFSDLCIEAPQWCEGGSQVGGFTAGTQQYIDDHNVDTVCCGETS